MKKYTSYKPSGVEWIGDIPEHWDNSYFKRYCNVKRGSSPRPIEDPKYFDDEGFYSWVRISDVSSSNRYLETTEEKLSELGSSLSTKMNKGDLFLSIAGSVGKPIITKIPCCIHDGFVWFQNLKLNKEFLYYLFKNGQCFLGLGKMGTQLNLNTDTIGTIRIPIPSDNEQHQIVQFLDEKTEIIDKLISTKERKIELLKEQRTSLINQVITKGLDPNVKMKGSGVEWIGEIPEHWETSKLGFYTTKIGSGSTPRGGSEVYVDSGIPFIRSQNVHFEGLRLDDISFIDTETHNSMKGTIVKKNDVLLNITGGSIGRCCIVHLEDEMNINQHVSIIRTTKDLTPFFLNYILYSDIGQSQVVYNVSGGNREGLTIEGIRNFKIILPPILEQIKIVQYLDNRTKEIDDLMSLEQKKIEVLKEYRQSLISEVITGKIDVRTN
ncbi:MAG: restriction endonuclease subunit S [Draconibacterium sp.]